MPLRDRKLKKEDWSCLIERVRKKLEEWQARFLSLGGRIVLINLVLSAIPLYQTAIYTMPKWVKKKIDRIRKEFLWVELGKIAVHKI